MVVKRAIRAARGLRHKFGGRLLPRTSGVTRQNGTSKIGPLWQESRTRWRWSGGQPCDQAFEIRQRYEILRPLANRSGNCQEDFSNGAIQTFMSLDPSTHLKVEWTIPPAGFNSSYRRKVESGNKSAHFVY